LKKIDLKDRFAFIFLSESLVDKAVKDLDGIEFGTARKRLRVELARGDGNIKRREELRRADTKDSPCDTLFVVNFDPTDTQAKHLEKIFGVFGPLKRLDTKKNYAFIQYETVDQAVSALKQMHGKKIGDREISVEFVARNQRATQRSRSPKRRNSKSPTRNISSSRSRSPLRHESSRNDDRRYSSSFSRRDRNERNDRSERGERNDRNDRGERNDRNNRSDRGERNDRGDRNNNDRERKVERRGRDSDTKSRDS